MTAPKPFTVAVPPSKLDWIAERVAQFPWETMRPLAGWDHGANLDAMKELAGYWQNGFDWRKAEAALNAYPQFTALVPVAGETLDLHFYHVKGKGPAPRVMLLNHGWPGSVFEFLHLIGPLTDPEAHGGKAEDAFTVVIPSLPGYGFSGKPSAPITPRDIAAAFDHLMMETLGYPEYLVQGGDWGSIIGGWMGFEAKGLKALHLNFFFWRDPGAVPSTEEENAYMAALGERMAKEFGYYQIQGTRPQSLAYGMADSPIGVAAWITEKFKVWGDVPGDDIFARFTKDQLLTNIMIYLVTDSFATASWLYYGFHHAPLGEPPIPAGSRVTRPTGYANFPQELLPSPPRSWLEKSYDIVHWTDMPKGGHFAALEEPELFLEDVRAFARKVA